MDQVRTILRIIWQQRFWVLTGLGLLIAAICWKMAAGSLDKEFAANKSTIDGKFKAMSDLSGQQVWGNDEVNAREFQETSAIRDKVLEMWQTLYRAQRDNVLKWPKGLGEEFLQYVEGKRFRTPISDPDMRQIYRQYAKEAFPDLVAIVQAQKIPDGTMSAGGMAGEMGGGRFDGAFGPPGGMGVQQFDAMGNPIEEEKYIVRWHDQVALRDQLDFRSLPTSLRVWLTQEDLWVYETLLHAIAKTNNEHGSTRYDNAAISDIYFLEVGRPAAMAFREPGLVSLPAAGMGAGGMEMDRGMESPPRGYEGDPMSSMGGMGAETVDPDAGLMAFRYIGDDGQPITDDTGAVDPSAQFRRLPVRMVLRMEQGAIPELLVQCANATLPVEVKRVRINSDKSEMGAAAT
ncbi:MAG TPA: hypothetical protein PKC18_19935, partial [Lacipirellulaceae bacterium]|nr:hypothetical protein [Lacipirellulaceae bacterium]